MKLDHTRHSSIFNAKDVSVVLIGAGGIGAITAVTLAKMGVGHLEVWDGDIVEHVNLATQYFRVNALGYNKASSIALDVQEYAPGISITYMNNLKKSNHLVGTIIISALDSLETRKMVWNVLFHECSKWSWYLDARMGAEEFMLYSVNHGEDFDWYDEHLAKWNDDDVPELPCTEKATIYTANGAAAFIGATVRNIITKEPVPKIRMVHFKEGDIYDI